MNIFDPSWLVEGLVEGAGNYVVKTGVRLIRRGTAVIISATGLPKLWRFVPTTSEVRFLARAKEQVDESVFPRKQEILAFFSEIRMRAVVLGGKRVIGSLDQFLADKIDFSDIKLEETGQRVADRLVGSLGRVIVSCECSSPSSVLMAEIAGQICPAIQIKMKGTTPDQQIEDLQQEAPEVAIMANAPYLLSSRASVRDRYKFYCPLYPGYNHIFIRGERKAPVQKIFVLDETSGREQQKMKRLGDSITDISTLDANSAYQICDEVNDGEVVVLWPPLTKDLITHGFREWKHSNHQTWIGFYLREDLMRDSPGTNENRKNIVKLLAWAWEKMRREPLLDIYTGIPEIRSRFASYWPD